MKNIKEQVLSLEPTTPKNENLEKLKNFVTVGCIPNGKIKENTGITQYPEAIITQSQKGNTLYFFHDGKIAMVYADGKLRLLPDTFTCEELIKQKQSQTTAETQAQTQAQTQANKMALIRQFEGQGWSTIKPLETDISYYFKLSEKDISKHSLIGVEMYMVDPTKVDELAEKLVSERLVPTKQSCKTVIEAYHKLASINDRTKTDAELDALAQKVATCEEAQIRWNTQKVPKMLNDIGNFSGERKRFAINFAINKRLKENMDLKNILKKNLTEVKESKESLQVETNIIKNRLSIITEGKSFEKDSDFLIESVIYELNYLKRQGYTSQAINEGLFDMLGGLFKNSVTSLPQVFGEYVAEYLMKILGVPADSYIGSVVKSFLTSINVSDYDKIFTDCRFTSNALSDAIIEGYLDKMQTEKGLTSGAQGFIFDALRNSVMETFAEGKDSLVQKLEDTIADFICPKFSKVASAMSDTADNIKSNVVSV
jgi:hypothetical protein